MLKIGEFSKLSMLTVKTLRFYEAEGILIPKKVDKWTGYRYYETSQLYLAAEIKKMRQLDFTVEEIKSRLNGASFEDILSGKKAELEAKQSEISMKLSVIHYLMEENKMNYQAVIKEIPECVVYSEEKRLKDYSEVTALVLESAEECMRINPGIECVTPDYCFCEYLDGEYREENVLARYSQAVTRAGAENERIKFRSLSKTKVISIYHKGAYDTLGEAYAYIMDYAEKNGYRIAGCPRESYIDGIWNKENDSDWLTEIQLPIE